MRTRCWATLVGFLALSACGEGADTLAVPSEESLTASSAPTISVSQSTGLVDGQSITVSGSGLPPDSYGYVWQLCRDFFPCVPYYGFSPTDPNITYHVDSEGTFELTLPAKLTLYSLPDGAARSCAEPGACFIRVSDLSPASTTHDFPLSFQATTIPPPQKGTASVVSSIPLTTGVLLRIEGAGWVSSRMLSLKTCTGAGYTLCGYSSALYADASGAFDLTQAQAPVFFPNDPSGSSSEVDCASQAGLCALVVADPFDFTATSVAVPLTFPPPGTPTTLSATLTPDQDLRDGDVIDVQVSGFPPGWSVSYCQRGSDQADCAGHVPPEGTTDANGVFQGPLLVRRAWGNAGSQWSTCVPYDTNSPFGPCQFYAGEPYTCDTPGACEVVVTASYGGVSQVFELPLNFIPQTPTAGAIALGSSSASAGSPIQVTGSGWETVGSVRVSLCRKNSTSAETCRDPKVVPVAQNGTFSAQVTAASFVKYNEIPFGQNPPAHLWHDCTAPGNCAVHVQGSTNSEVATELPVTVTAGAAAGTFSMDLRSPLIEHLVVRFLGNGWPAQRTLRVMTCGALVCEEMGPATTDGSGAFRSYVPIRQPFGATTSCSEPGACSAMMLDVSAIPTTAGPRAPLTFAQGEHFDVTSLYEAKWDGLLTSGIDASGLTAGEFQRTGAAVTSYVLRLGGATTGPQLPAAGDRSIVTSYTATEYRDWSRRAADHDYTVDELQKVGALFWAWLLAGQPPLPN